MAYFFRILFFLYLPLIGLAQTNSLNGRWEGKLQIPGGALPLVLTISDSTGSYKATLDSPMQGSYGLLADDVIFENDSLDIKFKQPEARYIARTNLPAGQLQGKWLQNGRELPLDFILAEDKPERLANSPDSTKHYRARELTFWNETDSVLLAGTLSLPADSSQTVALLISGSGPQDRNESLFGHAPFQRLANYLNEQGIAVLRYDDRGVGQSGGDYATATSKEFIRDARAGIDKLQELGYQQIGLIGHSEGGMLAAELAARDSSLAFAILLASPALPGDSLLVLQAKYIMEAMNLPPPLIAQQEATQRALFKIALEEEDDSRAAIAMRELFLNQSTSPAGLSPEQEAMVDTEIKKILSPWYRNFLQTDPRPALKQLTIPTLALFGSLDLQVPAHENASELQKLMQDGSQIQIQILKEQNHLFQQAKTGLIQEYAQLDDAFNDSMLRLIGTWLEGQLSESQ